MRLSPLERRRRRRAADRAILGGSRSALVDWRCDELLSPRRRQRLAHTLRALVRELDGRALPGASPANRRAARPLAPELGELAALLEETALPVAARGIVLLEELLTDLSSPLYARERAADLPAAIEEVRAALHARSR